MLTKTDFKKLKEIFLTKEEAKKLFTTKDEFSKTTIDLLDLIKVFRQELKDDIKNLKNEVSNEFREMRNDIIIFKDEILHEIIKLREDVTVTTGYRDMIEDHEQRIQKLEKKPLN